MKRTVERIVLGSKVEFKQEELSTKIISDILSYLYNDKKTARQVAEHIKKHQMVAVFYLEYLMNQGIVTCVEERIGYSMERFFEVEYKQKDMNMETKVDNKSEQIRIANHMADQIRDIIIGIEKGDCNYISYTVSMISREEAGNLINEQRKLEEMMSDLEKNHDDENIERERYIMVSTMAPYKSNENDGVDE